MSWYIFKKELKDTFRDRKTILLSVVIPILFNIALIFFMKAFLFGETEDRLTLAVSNQTDEHVVGWIEESASFEIIQTDDPEQSVRDGEAIIAIHAEEGFLEAIENNTLPTIAIFGDPMSSKGSQAFDLIERVFDAKKQEMVESSLIAQNVDPEALEPFTITFNSLNGENMAAQYILSIFAQLIIVLSVLIGGFPAANDLFAGEKERKTMEALLMTPVKRVHILVGKWLTIFTLGAASGIFSVLAFVTSVHLFADNLAVALNFEENIVQFTLSLFIGIVIFALLVASLEMVLSLFAKTMKEGSMYIQPVSMLLMLPYFFLVGYSANELTTTFFMIPFVNIYALIKQLIYGIYDLTNLLLVVGSSVILIVIFFLIGLTMFKKSKWVLGKS